MKGVRRITFVASIVLCFVAQVSRAFVPGPNKRAEGSSVFYRTGLKLYASYSPPPIPPPPPPPRPEQDLSVIDSLLRDLSSKLDNIELPTDSLTALKEQVASFDAKILTQLEGYAKIVEDSLIKEYPKAQPIYEKISALMAPLLQSPSLTLVLSAVLSYFLVRSVLNWGAPPPPSRPYPLKKYDPITARQYFDKRIHVVIARGLEIFLQSAQFGLKLLKDQYDGASEKMQFQRGRELAELLTVLGPTFIKIGQSLSIRADLLSPAYIRGLETLQDRVPPFDTKVAKQMMESEWGAPVETVLEELPSEPIAAASLGQVYKAKLKSTGEEVAIKVQRPNIIDQIALDMHLLRETAPILKRLGNLNTDTVGTVDAWGKGFVDELDYVQEGRNAEFFSEQIKESPLEDVVFAPRVVEGYSTGTVLMTEWIDGERLDRSAKADISVLCSIAMNTFLYQLLDIGTLHSDPHPGNLLRTPDGRLCILDWGMVTRINESLQLTLMEHMAHLTSGDYAEVPRDLLLLDFIPMDKADVIEDSGVVEVLADIYGQWTEGGGVASINVNDVISKLQGLTAEKGNLFQIPPYFAYIAKSFSVLEGIGLSNDPNYSIINGCLPYVSQRLLTDKERMGPALSTFIFGPNKADKDRIVDYKRVEQLIEGFSEYTTSASGALLGSENATKAEQLERAADQLLDIVFTEEETPLQEIFLEQMAKIITSSSRSIWTQLRERSGMLPSGRTVLGTIVDPFGLFRTSPLVRMNELDERTVETTRKLVALARKQLETNDNPAFDLSNLSRDESLELAEILVRKVWDRRFGVVNTGNRFARKLLQLTADKLERGERDTRSLPPPRSAQMIEPEKVESRPKRILPSNESVSPRLHEARKRLQALQKDDDTNIAVKPEVVPVKSDTSDFEI